MAHKQPAVQTDTAPGAAASFLVSADVHCHVFAVSDSVLRVAFQRQGQLRQPTTWMVLQPGQTVGAVWDHTKETHLACVAASRITGYLFIQHAGVGAILQQIASCTELHIMP